MARPLIASIEYNHNCICSDITERYPNANIVYLAEAGLCGDKIRHLFTVSGDEKMAFIDSARSHDTIHDVSILRKTADSVDISTVTQDDQGTAYALRESGCVFISNPVYQDGIEKIRIFAPSFSALGRFFDSLNNSYNVRIVSKHFLKEDEKITPENLIRSEFMEFLSAADLLTKRQIEAVKLASVYGYYEIPKRTSIAKIAERMDICESSASELLRKAEKKLLPAIAKIIQLQK